MDLDNPTWVNMVLTFWFQDLKPAQWFRRDEAVDTAIRLRFLAVHTTIAVTADAALLRNADTALAAIIVLDQFSRNIFRGDRRAFATDAKALTLAIAAVDRGLDQLLPRDQRLFVYLPFEHSEDALMQVRSVALIGGLGDAELTRYADAHKVIIDRFGRFPHRNDVLGRETTPEEAAFLKEPMSSF